MATSGSSSQSDNENSQGSGGSESSGMQGSVGASASEAVGQVQDTMSGLKDQVKQQASEQLSSRLETAVSGLEMAAKVLRTASDQVRQQQKTGIANSLGGVADRIEGWSTSLREQDVDKLIDETKQLAQRNPALFVGGATVLGFVGARFLTSSSKPKETSSSGTSTGGESGTAQDAGTDVSSMDMGTSDFDTTSSYQTADDLSPLGASIDETLGGDDITVIDDTMFGADVLLDDTVLEADVLLDDPMLESDLGESSLDQTSSTTRPEDR